MSREWAELKRPGIFDSELSYITMVAIARGSHKDILIVNIDHNAHSSIYVVRAEEYEGGERNNPNPVILAYNSSHYELVKSYKKGTYKINQDDLEIMTNIRRPGAQIDTTIQTRLIPKVMEYIKTHKCKGCTKRFVTYKDLTYHNRQTHMPNECNKCKIIVNGETSLNNHTKTCQQKEKVVKPKAREYRKITKTTNIFTI